LAHRVALAQKSEYRRWADELYIEEQAEVLPLFARHDRRAGRSQRQPLTERSVERVLAGYLKQAGIEIPITPHSLRHQLGTDILRATGNMRLVQKVLGHQSISTSQVYTHLADEDVDAAFAVLDKKMRNG
jgi:site-specific recombinase XerD